MVVDQELPQAVVEPNGATKKPPFRAIIVGGGPVGLGMAHALNHAGIDWVILERDTQIPSPSGASVALWPQSVRILDQLGLLDEAKACYLPVSTKHNHRPDGSEIDKSDVIDSVARDYGHPWMLFHRARLLELLYTNLHGREGRVFAGKEMKGVETHETGVRVTCADGTVVEGSIVIGCDGVHSPVRKAMVELRARKEEAEKNKSTFWSMLGLGGGGGSSGSGSIRNDAKPMKAEYYGVIGCMPRLDAMKPSAIYETRVGDGQNFQVLVGPETAYFLTYKKLDKPRQERVRHTEEETEALAKSLASQPVTKDFTFGDVWKAKTWARMVDYEEGFVQRWYHERIVLVGDAVHKVTPNAGFGLNTGWQGMAALTNGLRQLLLATASDPSPPDTATLEGVFKVYQDSRDALARETVKFSGLYTRVVAHTNILYRFLDWLSPYIGGDLVTIRMITAPIVKRAVVLDFLPEKDYVPGNIKWVNGKVEVEEEVDTDSTN